MKIEIATSAYNDRRYGRPYVATLDFSTDPKGTATFGDWVGNNGTAGMLVIEASAGQVVMKGQKDFRNSRNSIPEYGVVEKDGSIEWAENKVEAIALSRTLSEVASQESKPEDLSDAAKLAESQLRHAAQVATDNNQPNRAKFFEDMANNVFWNCPND